MRLASVRRSLFSNEAARSAFLNRLVAGTREVLAQQQGLARHANYHEFCRLLGRLKTNYQLSELVRALRPDWGEKRGVRGGALEEKGCSGVGDVQGRLPRVWLLAGTPLHMSECVCTMELGMTDHKARLGSLIISLIDR